jgi:transcriptional regulator of NAD metabolism
MTIKEKNRIIKKIEELNALFQTVIKEISNDRDAMAEKIIEKIDKEKIKQIRQELKK